MVSSDPIEARICQEIVPWVLSSKLFLQLFSKLFSFGRSRWLGILCIFLVGLFTSLPRRLLCLSCRGLLDPLVSVRLFLASAASPLWFRLILIIPHTKVDYWECSHYHVIELIEDLIIEDLARECGVEAEVVQGCHIHSILEETVKNQEGVSSVSFTTMLKEQALQVPELSESKIGSSFCL